MDKTLDKNIKIFHLYSSTSCHNFVKNNNIQIIDYCCDGKGFSINKWEFNLTKNLIIITLLVAGEHIIDNCGLNFFISEIFFKKITFFFFLEKILSLIKEKYFLIIL